MPQQLEFKTSNAVRAALSDTGRTEDVRFSPDNRRLILAGYGLNHLLILRIAIEAGPAGPTIVADDFMELTSDGITSAHGLDFIDDRTLAVANRDGLVSIIEIPSGELAGRYSRVDPIREISGSIFCRLKSPGSIAARRHAGGTISLLVCNNYTHRVTQHVVDPEAGYKVRKNSVLMERSLDIPDGIAVSRDERWIAVSNHGTHEVMLFDAAAPLGPYTEPVGVLTDVDYPHGLRFSPDDRHLLVADAGAPLIRVYERGDGWSGTRDPVRSVTVLDDETFSRGRANPMEGGPKGLDIDHSGTIVAATCEEQALAFFSLATMTGEPAATRAA
jgi:DNA-binding beta-propeller fold protein YncE